MWLLGKSGPMDVVETALRGRGWKYVRVDDGTIVTGVTPHSGRNYLISIRHEAGRKTVLFLFNPAKGAADAIQALSAGRPPFLLVHPAAGHSREQVAGACEILTSRNYSMLLGDFERDHADGEIRFRIALPYRDANLTAEQVNWCIEVAVSSLEVTLPKLEGFLNGTLSLEAAMGEAPSPMMV